MKSPKEAIIVGFLLAVHFVIAFTASLGKSFTIDEHAHLPAGIAYLKRRDYRLNPEHPPLPKLIAALPTVFMDIRWDELDP
ncbi:hypothetical protein HYR69_08050, partial [Candidatus Sumerlaeota bacterium]|nr:hypothetical protein [Candidatus Sumerlaeota bacterium]